MSEEKCVCLAQGTICCPLHNPFSEKKSVSAPMGTNGEAIPLPPLPDKTALSITMPDGMGMAMVMWGTKKCSGQKQALYTAEQMQDYARQAIAPYAERIRHLERELENWKVSNRLVDDSRQRWRDAAKRLERDLEQARAAFIGSENARKDAERARGTVQSIDTLEFTRIFGAVLAADRKRCKVGPTADQEWLTAYGALIAYIDGRTAGTAPDDVRDSTWRNLLDAVVREFPRHMGRSNNGNAPGHCHSRPGIWDDDNGVLAGKPCAWCIAWNGATQALPAAPTPLNGMEEAK